MCIHSLPRVESTGRSTCVVRANARSADSTADLITSQEIQTANPVRTNQSRITTTTLAVLAAA
jgi:hypothetical protein